MITTFVSTCVPAPIVLGKALRCSSPCEITFTPKLCEVCQTAEADSHDTMRSVQYPEKGAEATSANGHGSFGTLLCKGIGCNKIKASENEDSVALGIFNGGESSSSNADDEMSSSDNYDDGGEEAHVLAHYRDGVGNSSSDGCVDSGAETHDDVCWCADDPDGADYHQSAEREWVPVVRRRRAPSIRASAVLPIRMLECMLCGGEALERLCSVCHDTLDDLAQDSGPVRAHQLDARTRRAVAEPTTRRRTVEPARRHNAYSGELIPTVAERRHGSAHRRGQLSGTHGSWTMSDDVDQPGNGAKGRIGPFGMKGGGKGRGGRGVRIPDDALVHPRGVHAAAARGYVPPQHRPAPAILPVPPALDNALQQPVQPAVAAQVNPAPVAPVHHPAAQVVPNAIPPAVQPVVDGAVHNADQGGAAAAPQPQGPYNAKKMQPGWPADLIAIYSARPLWYLTTPGPGVRGIACISGDLELCTARPNGRPNPPAAGMRTGNQVQPEAGPYGVLAGYEMLQVGVYRLLAPPSSVKTLDDYNTWSDERSVAPAYCAFLKTFPGMQISGKDGRAHALGSFTGVVIPMIQEYLLDKFANSPVSQQTYTAGMSALMRKFGSSGGGFPLELLTTQMKVYLHTLGVVMAAGQDHVVTGLVALKAIDPSVSGQHSTVHGDAWVSAVVGSAEGGSFVDRMTMRDYNKRVLVSPANPVGYDNRGRWRPIIPAVGPADAGGLPPVPPPNVGAPPNPGLPVVAIAPAAPPLIPPLLLVDSERFEFCGVNNTTGRELCGLMEGSELMPWFDDGVVAPDIPYHSRLGAFLPVKESRIPICYNAGAPELGIAASKRCFSAIADNEAQLIQNQLTIAAAIRFLDPVVGNEIINNMTKLSNHRVGLKQAIENDIETHLARWKMVSDPEWLLEATHDWTVIPDDIRDAVCQLGAAAVVLARMKHTLGQARAAEARAVFLGAVTVVAVACAVAWTVAEAARAPTYQAFAGGNLLRVVWATAGVFALGCGGLAARYLWGTGKYSGMRVDSDGWAYYHLPAGMGGNWFYELQSYLYLPHPKQLLYRAMFRLKFWSGFSIGQSQLALARGKVELQVKPREMAKFGKAPRVVGACSTSILALLGYASNVKKWFCGELDVGKKMAESGHFPFPIVANVQHLCVSMPMDWAKWFTGASSKGVSVVQVTHSDDGSCLFNANGTSLFVDDDASSADSSLGATILTGILPALYSRCGYDHLMSACTMDFVCTWYARHPLFPKEVWMSWLPWFAAMPSGTANTTLLQMIFSSLRYGAFIASLSLDLELEEKARHRRGQGEVDPSFMRVISSRAVTTAARVCGGVSTFSLTEEPGEATFLKNCLQLTSTGEWIQAVCLGTFFRGFGAVWGDITHVTLGLTSIEFQRMDHTEHAERYLRGVVAGYKNEPSSLIWDALRIRYPSGVELIHRDTDLRYKQQAQSDKTDRSSMFVPVEAYIARYGGTHTQWEEFAQLIISAPPLSVQRSPIVDLLLQIDYGVA